MKKPGILLFLLICGNAFGQSSEQEARAQLMKKDSLFWLGYNTCKLDLMGQFLAEEMEFTTWAG
jgi:hypothetical protein